MKSWFSTKKRIAAVGLAGALVLGTAGMAAAFFASGSGTGQGSVAGGSVWSVSWNAPVGPPLYPGGPAQTMTFNVTNDSSSTQTINAVTGPSLGMSGLNITDNGQAVTGCLASWFVLTPVSGHTIAPATSVGSGASVSGEVTLSLLNPNVNQTACAGTSPDVNVSVS
jgi:hypothetical protein